MLYLVAPSLPELAGGRWAAPDWLIVGLAGLTAAFAVVYLVLRFRRGGHDGEPRRGSPNPSGKDPR